MKYTVLAMTQDILSAMDSDEVNSINDTIEAQQVARIIKNCYNDITTDVEFPDQYGLLQLDPSGTSTKPVVMYIPDGYSNIEWIRYDKHGDGTPGSSAGSWTSPDGVTIYYGTSEANFGSAATGATYQQFKTITFLKKEDFLNLVQDFNSEDTHVDTYTVDGLPLLCKNDKHPDYWTVLSNRTLVFDSYDSDVDTTLQSSKTMCYGKVISSFTLTDSWEINLDDKYTSYLFNEAKATAFSELKQVTNTRAEKQARLAKIKTQKIKKAAPYGEAATDDTPNYGRRYGPSTYPRGYYR
jgi:hypothetical protein